MSTREEDRAGLVPPCLAYFIVHNALQLHLSTRIGQDFIFFKMAEQPSIVHTHNIFFVHSSADGHLASNFTPESLCNQTSERCLDFRVDCGNHSNGQDDIFCFKTQPAELLERLGVKSNEEERRIGD